MALRLLEVMRGLDSPKEVLEDEDPSRTMPRRLGLSDVVDRQIRTLREDVRRGARVSDDEVQGLIRLVVRRPDAEAVFNQAGRLLAERRSAGWRRLLPRRMRLSLARTRARRGLHKLFGRPMGGFGRGPFVIEGRALFLIACDPGGAACHLLSGFCEETIEHIMGGNARVTHTSCESRRDPLCRWEAEVTEPYERVKTKKKESGE
ncbi:MAG: hypothetical protein AB7T31_03495 [Gemmatimonadales bacterium]